MCRNYLNISFLAEDHRVRVQSGEMLYNKRNMELAIILIKAFQDVTKLRELKRTLEWYEIYCRITPLYQREEMSCR